MSEHTPGPWSAPMRNDEAKPRTTGFVWAQEPHGGIVATVSSTVFYPPDRTQETANARLIAAAPDLLDALKAMVYGSPGPPEDDWKIEAAAREAIAKAEGAEA